jgi:hypothetical protein
VVEVKKETKRKEGLKDILKDNKSHNKKYQKGKYNNKENKIISGNDDRYNYKNKDYSYSGVNKKYYNSRQYGIDNDRQIDGYKDKKYDYYNKNNNYKRDYNNNKDNDYPGYNTFNTFRDSNSSFSFKHNFINSSKKNINNDKHLENPKDKKYNYPYPNYGRQYSQNTFSSGDFQKKKVFWQNKL